MKEIVSLRKMIENGLTKSSTLRLSMIKGAWVNISENFWLKSEPLSLKNGLLYVIVENSSFLHAMTMKKNVYIYRINKLLRAEYVVDINFRIGKINLKEKKERGESLELEREKKVQVTEFKTKDMSIEESIKYLSKLSKKREAALLKKGYKKCRDCKKIFWGQSDLCPICRGEKENLTINKY